MAQAHTEVSSMARMRTMNRATASDPMPRIWVSAMRKIKAMKVDTMNTSPCAKFTMPMMPNTIV